MNTVTTKLNRNLPTARMFKFGQETVLCTSEVTLAECLNNTLLKEIGRDEYDLLQERQRILIRLAEIEGDLRDIRGLS